MILFEKKENKISKKILSLLLTLTLIFGMAGCAGDDNKASEGVIESSNLYKYSTDEALPEGANSEEKVPQEIYRIGITSEIPFTSVDLKDIPDYSGTPYVEINNNIPYFPLSDFNDISFESYSDLDIFGRCGTAYANIGRDLMPTEKRKSIGQVRPSGWHTVKYDSVDGKYLYNRCHLIGFQLTGENANEKNLITGTRYMNNNGMLPFENMVADYIKETGNHVLYRVTPIFHEKNLLATGVQIEAMSVEDEGEGILFNVFCYNSQPGIKINLLTGSSELISKADSTKTPPKEINKVTKDSHKKTESKAKTESGTKSKSTKKSNKKSLKQTYILNTSTYKFHYPTCHSVKQMSDRNKQKIKTTREKLIQGGYEPCGNCNP